MTKKLYEIKDMLLDELKKDVESGNVNMGELGIMADVIKDLAEAEKYCWEACYFKSVSEAMEEASPDRMGYYGPDGSSVGSNAPVKAGYSGMMGYQGQQGRSTGGGRQGYSDQSIENVRKMMQSADPTRKKQLAQDLRELMMELSL